MAYTSDKKPGALTAATVLDGNNNVVVEQSGDVKRATLSQVEAKIFDSKTAVTNPTGTEVVVVRLTDGNLRQVALSNIVPPGNITNAKVSDSAAIADTKLATIATAGKVLNSATTATPDSDANTIVARDGSGNFSAGTITATLAGSITGNAATATAATTATILATGRTIALTGDVTGTTESFNGSANVSATTTIANSAVTTAKIADANVTTAKIADANVTTAKIADANVTTAKIADENVTTAKIADANVTTAKIADENVTTAKIADANVTTAKILDGAVTNAKLSLSANDGEIKKALNADNAPPIFAARAWVLFDGDTFANAGGTYARSGTVGTITTTNPHGQIAGHRVYINVTSGGLASGEYVVQSVTDANTFTVTIASGSGGGTMSLRRRSITAQGNVNDVAAIDTGLYHVNTSERMPSANYAVVTTCNESGVARQLGASQGTATFRIETRNASGTIVNASRVSAVVFA